MQRRHDERSSVVAGDRRSVLVWNRAEHSGSFSTFVPELKPMWLADWVSKDQSVSWRVQIEQAGDYHASLIYACPRRMAGTVAWLRCGGHATSLVLQRTGQQWDGGALVRGVFEAPISLPAGEAKLVLRLDRDVPDEADGDQPSRVLAVELTPVNSAAVEAEHQRALALRSSTRWMTEYPFGLMVTWSAHSCPRTGERKEFQRALRDFNVAGFADAVAATGAGHVVFTTTHGEMQFSGPNTVIDRILPGCTGQRDLIGDIADALAERGVRLLLYYHYGWGDTAFLRATGARFPAFADGVPSYTAQDLAPFFRATGEVLAEMVQRYGRRVAGYFVDDGFLPYCCEGPFEAFTRILKSARPDAVVAYNSWIYPHMTAFQDFWCGEGGGKLMPPPDGEWFKTGGPQEGLQPHLNFYIEDAWGHYRTGAVGNARWFKPGDFAPYIDRCIKAGHALSINVGPYQDGSIAEQSLELLGQIRRGNP